MEVRHTPPHRHAHTDTLSRTPPPLTHPLPPLPAPPRGGRRTALSARRSSPSWPGTAPWWPPPWGTGRCWGWRTGRRWRTWAAPICRSVPCVPRVSPVCLHYSARRLLCICDLSTTYLLLSLLPTWSRLFIYYLSATYLNTVAVAGLQRVVAHGAMDTGFLASLLLLSPAVNQHQLRRNLQRWVLPRPWGGWAGVWGGGLCAGVDAPAADPC